jgi:hypothetical protein
VEKLPQEFMGFTARKVSEWGGGRVGVFKIGEFYRNFIGLDRPPVDLKEWRVMPEAYLAECTNGKVFRDPLGEFTQFRNKLKEFYPEDLRLKKIAARCMTVAQQGQYNFLRCVRRREHVAALHAESEFCQGVLSLVFLLNKEYAPFYKWRHRAVKQLPILGEFAHSMLLKMATTHEGDIAQTLYEKKLWLIEEICQNIIKELKRQGLSDSPSDFLLDHGPQVQQRIKDLGLRIEDVWLE